MYRVDILKSTYADGTILFSQWFESFQEAKDWVKSNNYLRSHAHRIEWEDVTND